MEVKNIFAGGRKYAQKICEKKILRKFLRKFFLEPFKVKNLIVIVTWIFCLPNIIRFWCLGAQKKAKVDFYKTEKMEKKLCRLGT